jgi:hypothetical protein
MVLVHSVFQTKYCTNFFFSSCEVYVPRKQISYREENVQLSVHDIKFRPSEQTCRILAMSPDNLLVFKLPRTFFSLWRQLSISIYGSTVLLLDLGRFFSSLILHTVGRTPWTGDQPVARPPPTHTAKQTQNKRTQTSIPPVGFEPTFPAF